MPNGKFILGEIDSGNIAGTPQPLSIQIDGTEAINVNTSGRVGIGTGSPDKTLDIVSVDDAETNAIEINGKSIAARGAVVNYYPNGNFVTNFRIPTPDVSGHVTIDTGTYRTNPAFGTLKWDSASDGSQYRDMFSWDGYYKPQGTWHQYTLSMWVKNTSGITLQFGIPGGGGDMLFTVPGDGNWYKRTVYKGTNANTNYLECRMVPSSSTGAVWFSEIMLIEGDARYLLNQLDYIPSIYDTAQGLKNEIGTQVNPAISATDLVTAGMPDGQYYVNINGTAQQVYVITRYGSPGYVKFVQYNDGFNTNTSAATNAGGSWTANEIDLSYGKLSTADINYLIGRTGVTKTLMKVTGGSDNLFNSGSATGYMDLSSGYSNWGTADAVNRAYELWLDTTSDGTWNYKGAYTSDTRGECSHTTNSGTRNWHYDHNYNSSWIGSAAPYNSLAICHSVKDVFVATNLHWMSGQSSSSGGDIYWGHNSSSAWAFYIEY